MAINGWNKHDIQSDDYKIIIDEPAENAPDFKEHAERLSRIIVRSKPQFTVGIFGGWGTGKTTMMRMINDEIKKNYSDIATTIWFDSWRYEKEEYSLMIPLLRTIILTLHAVIVQLTDDEKKKTIKRMQRGFVKMIKAVARGTGANLGAEAGTGGGKVSVGLSLDFAKILDEYASEGHAFFKQKRIYFHEHVSDYLKEELEGIKDIHRLVLFIDDLDRCTPEGALEILESIKTFFDIEGIIYVIGMDPSTIDPIIQVKYGKNPKISGLDYMQKIVQLPFQIPIWSDEDLGRTIKRISNDTGLPKDITDKLLEQEIKDLIINSAKLNPRNIKRFINSLVLSYSTSGENIKVVRDANLRNYIIENYLRSMISIQTFYFRGEKWLRLLKMIINYYERTKFLTHFITVVKSENISYHDLRDKIKVFPAETLRIYNEIIEINDEDLFTFLQEASIPLLRIDKIENYLRAVDTKNIDTTRSTEVKSYESLDKLSDGIESFNEYVQGSNLHLPCLDLTRIFELKSFGDKFARADLFGAVLFRAKLSWADEDSWYDASDKSLGANLSKANLAEADLREVDLSWADLSEANLSSANLTGANLSSANLTGADFTRADLSSVNVSNAELTTSNLSAANLSNAELSYSRLTDTTLIESNLSSANLTGADFTRADLSWANLTEANLTEANLTEANLSNAILTWSNLYLANLTGANMSSSVLIEPQNYESIKFDEKSNFNSAKCDMINFIYHVSKFILPENIPNIVNNKKELRLLLERRMERTIFSKQQLDSTLKISRLPE